METLSLTLQTAYAEPLDQLVAADAHRTMGHLAGTFVTKEIRGRTYVYFQYSAPGGTTKQVYVGPRERSLDKLVAQYEKERAAVVSDRERIEELCAVLRTGAIRGHRGEREPRGRGARSPGRRPGGAR